MLRHLTQDDFRALLCKVLRSLGMTVRKDCSDDELWQMAYEILDSRAEGSSPVFTNSAGAPRAGGLTEVDFRTMLQGMFRLAPGFSDDDLFDAIHRWLVIQFSGGADALAALSPESGKPVISAQGDPYRVRLVQLLGLKADVEDRVLAEVAAAQIVTRLRAEFAA